MANPAPFTIDPYLTGIAIAYQNGALIADSVLPRIPVGKSEYKFTRYPIAEEFRIPNTFIGRTGQVRQIELTGTSDTSSVSDYGIEIPVPQRDIDNAPPNIKPLDRATKKATNIILLDREVRVAGLVFNSSSYGSGNRITLSGSSQFSDPTSDPIGVVNAGIDACMQRPNKIVFGRAAWTGFRANPKVVKAANKNSGDSGNASRQAVADLFEVADIQVGESFLNTAKPGQAATLSRVWGKHIALLYIDPLADNQDGITFGWTAQWKSRVAGSRALPDVGLEGATAVRSGEMVEEKIIANDCGYFIQNAVA